MSPHVYEYHKNQLLIILRNRNLDKIMRDLSHQQCLPIQKLCMQAESVAVERGRRMMAISATYGGHTRFCQVNLFISGSRSNHVKKSLLDKNHPDQQHYILVTGIHFSWTHKNFNYKDISDHFKAVLWIRICKDPLLLWFQNYLSWIHIRLFKVF
jgi:hypothetical protein